MENITLGQIATAVAFLVALITGVSFLHKKLKEWLSQLLTEKFNAIDRRTYCLGLIHQIGICLKVR